MYSHMAARGASYIFITTVRDPLSWAVSLYTQQHKATFGSTDHPNLSVLLPWAKEEITKCPSMLMRQVEPDSPASCTCTGQFANWAALIPSDLLLSRAEKPHKLASSMIGDYLNHTSIVLVTERWFDSLTLLAAVFGVPLDPKLAEVKLNQKSHKKIDGSVPDLLNLQSFLSSETYAYTVYTAAVAQFEDDIRSLEKRGGAALGSRTSLTRTDLIPPTCIHDSKVITAKAGSSDGDGGADAQRAQLKVDLLELLERKRNITETLKGGASEAAPSGTNQATGTR